MIIKSIHSQVRIGMLGEQTLVLIKKWWRLNKVDIISTYKPCGINIVNSKPWEAYKLINKKKWS